jgi:hypothetical protein
MFEDAEGEIHEFICDHLKVDGCAVSVFAGESNDKEITVKVFANISGTTLKKAAKKLADKVNGRVLSVTESVLVSSFVVGYD